MAHPRLNDWGLTAWQAVPRLAGLLKHMRPGEHLAGLDDLERRYLPAHPIRGIIWDVDGTLMPRHGLAVAPALEPVFSRLLARTDLRHVILSNCGETRFMELGRIFGEIPVLRIYRQGSGHIHRRLWRGEDRWTPSDGATRVESGAEQLRKPDVELIEFAVRELGTPKPETLMVGDQYLTDVVGANLAGICSVKLPTLDRASFPLPVRLMQRAEAVAYRLLHA